MGLIYPAAGLIIVCSWMVFLLHEQRDQIISLKQQVKELKTTDPKFVACEQPEDINKIVAELERAMNGN